MPALDLVQEPRRRARPATAAVGYVRRSTDRQEQSIPDQKKAIEEYARDRDLSLLRFYVDDAISGTTSVQRRAFQEVVSEAQARDCPFSTIIVYDVKRFGRVDNDEAGYYRHILKSHGVEVLYVSENFAGDGTDDLLRPVKQWQAREESKDLSRVTIRGLLSKVETGAWMGGAPPYGYDLGYETPEGAPLFRLRFLPDGSKELLDSDGRLQRRLLKGESLQLSKRDHARLIPSSKERVDVIQRIFTMAAEGARGLGAIADALNREKIPTPRGPLWARIYQGAWTKGTIRAILENPVYTGDLVWNRRTDARFFRIAKGRATERKTPHGARLVPNPQEDWIRVPGVHPALVSQRLFAQAHAIRTGRPVSLDQAGQNPRVVGGWNGQRSRFLLSGLGRCARCGGRYEGCKRTKGRRRTDGTPVFTYSYGCGHYIRKGRSACSFGPLPQKDVENLVVRTVLEHFAPLRGKAGRARIAELLRDVLKTDTVDLHTARTRAVDEAAELDRSIARLLDHLGEKTRDVIEERVQALTEERTRVRERIEELGRLELSRAEADDLLHEIHAFVSQLETELVDGPPEQRVRALRLCVKGLVFATEPLRVTLELWKLPQLGPRLPTSTVTVERPLEPSVGSMGGAL